MKEEPKKHKEKRDKKNIKKNVTKKQVKKSKTPKQNYFKQVGKELKLVKWPTAKEILKYTIATIAFCVIISIFFQLLVLLMSYIKEIFA